jgi:hypothetical protein
MAEDKLLAGRVAIVTGAASGMGRVMARALADAGAKIAGVDVDAAGLSRLAAEPVLTGKFLRTVTDVSKTAECRRAVQQVMETFGALDILINCAGVSMSTAAGHSEEARIKFFEADPEGWQRPRADRPRRPVSFRQANRGLPFCSTPRSWGCRWYGSPRPNPTASAPAASSHAIGIGAWRRPRPRHGRARRLHGPHSRRPRVQPGDIRCSRHVRLVPIAS